MTEIPRFARSTSPARVADPKLSESLRIAASRGQLDLVRDLLARGAKVEPDKDGCTALHYAALGGHTDCCKMLVSSGCDINQQDKIGFTSLMKAASHGAYDTVHFLLEAGCNVNTQDEQGNTALHEACWNGFSKTAELLVQYNCDVCMTNKSGFTALHLASQNGHNESSRVLLYAGCNPDLKNNYGDTALHTASRYGHAGVARILISAKCKLSEQNKNGDTSLHIAAALKRRKIAKILVESGIDVMIVNKQNETAIDVAKRKEHPEIILLISSYATPQSLSYMTRGEITGTSNKDQLITSHNEIVNAEQIPEPKQEKENKRFFLFRKKKKEKDKPVVSPLVQKKLAPEVSNLKQPKPAVHGFFSQYVPRDGLQLYRDLAGNVKQGPIGYAPVCQCGPSLKRLENNITDTKDSLYNYVDASHHILAQRIEHLDMHSEQHAHATEAMVNQRFFNEEYACQGRISSRLEEERLETQAYLNQASNKMKDQLEYWLNDKLASYGHCLDHHHDDTALPPRNLFTDFMAKSNLVRSRSDETLTASDYSGKFRKKDFYTSRQAAMQQIRGWDVPNLGSRDKARRQERNNNSAMVANKMTVQAQVHHTRDSDRNVRVSSPNVNSAPPVPHRIHQDANLSRHPYGGSINRDVRSKSMDRPSSHHRVTFSNEPYHPPKAEHMPRPAEHIPRPSHTITSSPSQTGIHSRTDLSHRQQYPVARSSNKSQSNFQVGCPPNTIVKSSEQGGTLNSQLTGQRNWTVHNTKTNFEGSDRSAYSSSKSDGRDSRELQYQESNFSRTFSMDSKLNSAPPYVRQHISRSHSAENTLDINNPKDFHTSGYMTDSGIKTSYGSRYSQHNIGNSHSSSPASMRYQVHGTSTPPPTSKKPQSTSSSSKFFSSDNAFNVSSVQDNSKESAGGRNMIASKLPDQGQFTGANRVETNQRLGTIRHFISPMKECLQHDILNPSVSSPPVSTTLNKEDSTCSSNPDSGYGSRNPYGLKSIETSGGTPSSSFCLERSSSDIPSNTGSPITFSDTANHSFRSDLAPQSPRYNTEQYSIIPFHSRQLDQQRNNDSLNRPSSSDRVRGTSKPLVSQRPNVTSRPPPTFTSTTDISQSAAFTEGQRHTRESSCTDSGIQLTYPYHNSAHYQVAPPNSTQSISNNYCSPKPQTLPKPIQTAEPLRQFNQTIQEFNNSLPLRSSSNMPQSAIQSHVQGWYQQKLLEAAQRLRQSESYNILDPYSNEKDRVSVGQVCYTSYQPDNQSTGYKNLHQTAESRSVPRSTSAYEMRRNSSQPVPTESPHDKPYVRAALYGKTNQPPDSFYSDKNRNFGDDYQSDSQSHKLSQGHSLSQGHMSQAHSLSQGHNMSQGHMSQAQSLSQGHMSQAQSLSQGHNMSQNLGPKNGLIYYDPLHGIDV